SSERNYLIFVSNDEQMILSFSKMKDDMLYVSIQNLAPYVANFQSLVLSYFALTSMLLLAYLVFGVMSLRRKHKENQILDNIHPLKQNIILLDIGGHGQIRNSNLYFKALFDSEKTMFQDI